MELAGAVIPSVQPPDRREEAQTCGKANNGMNCVWGKPFLLAGVCRSRILAGTYSFSPQ